MDELIYRQDAANILCDWCDICPKEERDIMHCDDVCPEFAMIPSARKKGHWIERHYLGQNPVTVQVCNQCRTEWSYDAETGVSDYNYCPHCGADMRGEADGENS